MPVIWIVARGYAAYMISINREDLTDCLVIGHYTLQPLCPMSDNYVGILHHSIWVVRAVGTVGTVGTVGGGVGGRLGG